MGISEEDFVAPCYPEITYSLQLKRINDDFKAASYGMVLTSASWIVHSIQIDTSDVLDA